MKINKLLSFYRKSEQVFFFRFLCIQCIHWTQFVIISLFATRTMIGHIPSSKRYILVDLLFKNVVDIYASLKTKIYLDKKRTSIEI